MSGPQDLTLSVEAGPKGLSLFLSDIGAYFAGETAAVGGDVVVPRIIAKLFTLGFREAAYRSEAFEETLAVCARLEATVRIQEAEIARLKRQLATQTGRVRLAPVGGAVIHDLSEEFARARAQRGHRDGGDVA